ncbi:MAG: Hsp20/alpha crystallin family protein [Desulfobacterales bacterium]|nr:MAG: Hsp20/alpha crystallin family protein [Desulfobacterales bacterium]
MFELMPWKKRGGKEISRLGSELDDLYGRFFGRGPMIPERFLQEEALFPALDISEGKKEITVKAEIPGVEADDLDVSLDGRTLIIKGEKKQEKEDKDENYHRMERSYGYFRRTVQLPVDVDPSKVEASYKKGVLKVTLKKTKESEAKKIEVR